MSTTSVHWRQGGLLVVGLLLVRVVLAGGPPVNIVKDAQTLQQMQQQDHQRLRNSGNATVADHRAVDDAALELAREAEIKRAQALKDLGEKALGDPQAIKQGPGGTNPSEGRGILGDVDTGSMSGRSFDKVIKSAQDAGYTISGEGDFRTINELNTTIHRETTPYSSPQGSTANELETARGYGKETSLSYHDPVPGETPPPVDKNIKVMDNLKKGADTLTKPAGEMTPDDLQNLGKMTGRNMEAGGVENPTLAEQAKLLKQGYSPESAGVVAPNATDAQVTEQIGKFQQQAHDANIQAAQNTTAEANANGQKLQSTYEQAQTKYQAAQNSGDPEALAQASAELHNAKGNLIDHNTQQAAAQEAVVRNQTDGAKILNDINGNPVEKITGPGGEVGYKNPQTGETMTPSQVKETVLEPTQTKVVESVNTPAGEPPPEGPVTSPGMKGAGYVVAAANLYQSSQQGGERAVNEEQPGDSNVKTYGKAMGYTVWYASGIPTAIDTGEKAGNDAMDQYNKEKAEGKDPSWVWAKFKGAANGVGTFVKAMTWDQLANGAEAIKEGVGLAGDLYGEHEANNQQHDQEEATKKHKAEMAAANPNGTGDGADATTKPGTGKGTGTGTDTGSVPPGNISDGTVSITGGNNSSPGTGDGTGDGTGPGNKPNGLAGAEAPNAPNHNAPPNDGESGPGNVLNGFVNNQQNNAQQNAANGTQNMNNNQQVAQASNSGNQQLGQANQTVNSAGQDGQTTKNNSATQTATTQNQNSWGNQLGNGIANGVQQGLTAAATTFGNAAGSNVTSQIFGPQTPPTSTGNTGDGTPGSSGPESGTTSTGTGTGSTGFTGTGTGSNPGTMPASTSSSGSNNTSSASSNAPPAGPQGTSTNAPSGTQGQTQTAGSFTAQVIPSGSSYFIKVTGKPTNNLTAAVHGTDGYTTSFSGVGTITSSIIPAGAPGVVDSVVCNDKDTGETATFSFKF